MTTMTKHEMFAAAALTGLTAQDDITNYSVETTAAWAFELADAMVRQSMIKELERFCRRHGLPQASADELLMTDLSKEQRSFLQDFCDRWNEIEMAND